MLDDDDGVSPPTNLLFYHSIVTQRETTSLPARYTTTLFNTMPSRLTNHCIPTNNNPKKKQCKITCSNITYIKAIQSHNKNPHPSSIISFVFSLSTHLCEERAIACESRWWLIVLCVLGFHHTIRDVCACESKVHFRSCAPRNFFLWSRRGERKRKIYTLHDTVRLSATGIMILLSAQHNSHQWRQCNSLRINSHRRAS